MHPDLTFIIHSHIWRFLPRLTNRNGEAFLQRYCGKEVSPQEALKLKAMSYPFSVRTDAKYVDIGIFREIAEGRGGDQGGVFLDVTHVPKGELVSRAPITYHTLLSAGIDCVETPIPVNSCTPYLNGNMPMFGEHIAWGESSAIAFANSVIGARSNREGGPTALAAAITGCVPAYGYHLDENRKGTHLIRVDVELKTDKDYAVLGYFGG